MGILSWLQGKRGKQLTNEVELKTQLLAGVLSSGFDNMQYRRMASIAQEPIDPQQLLYGKITGRDSSKKC